MLLPPPCVAPMPLSEHAPINSGSSLWTDRCVLITGANGGLGRAAVRMLLDQGARVVGAARTEDGAHALRAAFPEAGERLRTVVIDVTDDRSVARARADLIACDGLIHNAGLGDEYTRYNDRLAQGLTGAAPASILDVDFSELERHHQVHGLGALRLFRETVPAMVARGFGRVVAVSSMRSTLAEISGDIAAPSYRLSKLQLNGVVALTAHEIAHPDVRVNAVCPGWCRTRMGGPAAPHSDQDGARRIVDALSVPSGGWHGQLLIEGAPHAF